MGLITGGLKLGALALAADHIMNRVERHQENKHKREQMTQESYQNPPPYQYRDVPHQSWCDGNCGGQCTAQQMQASQFQAPQPQTSQSQAPQYQASQYQSQPQASQFNPQTQPQTTEQPQYREKGRN
jgi:hypothetical protein